MTSLRHPRRLLLALVALATVAATTPGAADEPPAATGTLVTADDFTGTAGPLEEGQIEVAVLSTRAATVTGEDALIGVRGVAEDDTVTITVNGRDVTTAFAPEPDPFGAETQHLVGLVDGLRVGENRVTAVVDGPTHGRRSATLPVTDHPITGPVFSGPHQEPFVCRVQDLRDYAPGTDERPEVLDDDCSIETYVRWYYLSDSPPDGLPFDPAAPGMPDEVPYDTWDWVELTDPYGEYPADVATTVTTEGEVVPAIARVETTTINRGITRIAILDDPAARGPEAPFEVPEAWNERVVYNWGASCGIGRQQGINTPNEVLSGGVDAGGSAIDVGPEVFRPAVLQGYLTAHSSLTIFNTHCNQVLSAETFMMVREHITERYGRVAWVMGNGASGGAIQQYTTMNTYPGLLDGGVPLVSFPDVVTTAMSPVDCRLLRQVFQLDDGANPTLGGEREVWTGTTWSVEKQTAITGHAAPGICEDWDTMFADLVVADQDCSRIPTELRYSRETRTGERCTLQDNLRHYLGIDPETGYAPIPIDNVGVQYGLQALVDGTISVDEFVYLNRTVGGLDDEGYGPWDPDARVSQDPADGAVQPRMSMSAELAERLYRYGFVGGRGAMDQAPMIDVDLYVDPVPILGFHDQVRSYMSADRIEETFGARQTHVIWSGAVLTNDAWSTMHAWLDEVEAGRRDAGGASASWADTVETAKPVQAEDSCVVTTAGYSPVPLAAPGTAGDPGMPCEQVFRPLGSPRIVAGGPRTEDVVKCQLKPLDAADYPGVTFTPEQWAELERIFVDGVCDYGRPGVGEVERSLTWLDWGDDHRVPDEPEPIPNLVARSTTPAR